MSEQVLIAMSGGVDSTVAAALMIEKGYDCVGVTMNLHHDFDTEKVSIEKKDVLGAEKACADNFAQNVGKSCGSGDDIKDAANAAKILGISHHVYDFKADFKCKVIEPFVNSYLAGETPNPCIICNRYMKFEALYQRGEELGCNKVVTGHYARIAYNEESGRWQLRTAMDETKDQSYVLYSLTQEQLAHTLFPLGELKKTEVREIAQKYEFLNAHKKESQDICFVPDGHYEKFIEDFIGHAIPQGDFVDVDGKILGKHKGIINYTVGQRKGLGISSTEPYFVKELRPETNQVVLCRNDALFTDTLYAKNVNWVSMAQPVSEQEEIRVTAKIRYKHVAQPAVAKMLSDGRLMVKFDEPQRAITKGQAVVLYDEDKVVAGGTIC